MDRLLRPLLGRPALVACIAIVFSGCHTVIDSQVKHHMSSIEIAPICEQYGVHMRCLLESALNRRSAHTAYRLNVQIKTTDQVRVFGLTGKSTVQSEKLVIQYTLTRLRDNAVLLEKSHTARTTRPFTQTPYAQTVAREHQIGQTLRTTVHTMVRHIAMALNKATHNPSSCTNHTVSNTIPA